MSPVEYELSSSVVPGSSSFSLALPASVLGVRTTFTFSLEAVLTTGHSGVATVQISTNGPPNPGAFSISPINGTEFSSLFEWRAGSWEDPDLPITYAFGYVEGYQISVTQMRSESNTASRVLPAGDATSNFERLVGVRVYDSLDAEVTETATVHVMR